MPEKKLKVLVINPEPSLTGSTILLLNLFRLIKERNYFDFSFVMTHKGCLLHEFKNLSDTIVIKNYDRRSKRPIARRAANFISKNINVLAVYRQALLCDVILSNTIINVRMLNKLAIFKKPVIIYVHELEGVIDFFISPKKARRSINQASLVTYPSTKVKEMLAVKFRLQAGKAKRLSYYFPSFKNYSTDFLLERRNSFRETYNIPIDSFVIGGMGQVTPRKGTDIFIKVCADVCAINPGIHFCWIGEFLSLKDRVDIENQLRSNNLQRHITFTGPLKNNSLNQAAFDLFFLSSREDPYPLVVIEAAFLKIPSVCFGPFTGITEFIEEDAGWVLEDFSIKKAASLIIELARDKSSVQKKGERAFQKAVEYHANEQAILQQIDEVVCSLESNRII